MSFRSFLIIACLLFGFFAEASYLQMVSRQEGEFYYLKNNGNETARNVHPSIQVGKWSKDFEAFELGAGEEAEWTLPLKEMHKNLPRGRNMMTVMIHYQDLNGYPFAVPEVREFLSENLSSLENEVLGIPMVRPSLTVEPMHNQEFRVRYEVENLTDEKIKVTPKLWIPEELQLKTTIVPLELGPKAKVEGFFEIHNEKGLEGSYYNLIATFEYQHGGLNDFQSVYGGINITKEDVKPRFRLQFSWGNFNFNWWWPLGIFFVLGYVALYLKVIRPLKK